MSVRSRRRFGPLLFCALVVLAASAMLLANLFAEGVGRVLADVWVATMTAILGLLGPLMGA